MTHGSCNEVLAGDPPEQGRNKKEKQKKIRKKEKKGRKVKKLLLEVKVTARMISCGPQSFGVNSEDSKRPRMRQLGKTWKWGAEFRICYGRKKKKWP